MKNKLIYHGLLYTKQIRNAENITLAVILLFNYYLINDINHQGVDDMNCAGNGRVVCNYCGEDIASDSKRCPYCGSVLKRENSSENDDVKLGDYGKNDSQIQDTDRLKSNFDDPVGNDIYGTSFNNEEKVYEPKSNDSFPEANANSQAFGERENPVNEYDSERSYTQQPQETKPVQATTIDNVARQQGEARRSSLKQSDHARPSINNALKVLCTSACSLVLGLGQLIGVIIAIVCMNSEGDTDKRSFGLALLVNCIIIFVFWCFACCIAVAVFGD